MPYRVLLFDSGLGGLSVYAPLIAMRPDLEIIYLADDDFFPYGDLDEDVLISRVQSLIETMIPKFAPTLVLIACSTASTLALTPLRARFPHLPFVGTVPAVKPAALASRSKQISLLATPGTVKRDYTQRLIQNFAQECEVAKVGAPHLAHYVEQILRGVQIADKEIRNEIAPAFVTHEGRQTDHIVLACTHFPLILDRLKALASWPVTWVDPGPAIARHVATLLQPAAESKAPSPHRIIFTRTREPEPYLQKTLLNYGLAVSS